MRSKRQKPNSEQLANEAQQWTDGIKSTEGWESAPNLVPRASEAESVTIMLPKKQLKILREIAKRDGVSLDLLIKLWLDNALANFISGKKPITVANK